MPRVSRHGWRSFASGVFFLAGLLFAGPSYGFSVAGVEISDFVVLDLDAGSSLSLSTTEDIYILAPLGLSASAVSLIATGSIVFEVPIDVSGVLSLCDTVHCVAPTPAFFQDVVLRVDGFVGDLDLASGGSIVVGAVPVPEPTSLLLVSSGIFLLALARRQTLR